MFSIAENTIKVTLKDRAANDGKDLRERIKKDSKSIPLGASLRWAVNSSEGGFLQLQVKDPPPFSS